MRKFDIRIRYKNQISFFVISSIKLTKRELIGCLLDLLQTDYNEFKARI